MEIVSYLGKDYPAFFSGASLVQVLSEYAKLEKEVQDEFIQPKVVEKKIGKKKVKSIENAVGLTASTVLRDAIAVYWGLWGGARFEKTGFSLSRDEVYDMVWDDRANNDNKSNDAIGDLMTAAMSAKTPNGQDKQEPEKKSVS